MGYAALHPSCRLKEYTVKTTAFKCYLLFVLFFISSSTCLADVTGVWDIWGIHKIIISGGGHKHKSKSNFMDTMTFNADHTFQLGGFGGTWIQNNRSFKVFRDAQVLADALEASLIESGVAADIVGVGTKMRGQESRNGQRIKGTAMEKLKASFPDLPFPANIRVLSSFIGNRSGSPSAASDSFMQKLIQEPGSFAQVYAGTHDEPNRQTEDQEFVKRLANGIKNSVAYMARQYR